MAGFLKKHAGKAVVVLVIAAALVLYFATRKEEDSYAAKYAGFDFSAGGGLTGRSTTYANYLNRYSDSALPGKAVEVELAGFLNAQGTELLEDFEGEKEVLLTKEDSQVEFKVMVPESGLYTVYLEYYPVKGRGIDIERCFTINGKVPFLGAEALTFSRIWGDGGEVKRDNQGNDIRPVQMEKPRWEGSFLDDYMGYFTEPYRFYFEKGENTIGFTGVNESMAIRRLALLPVEKTPEYADYIKEFEPSEYAGASGDFVQKLQGEDAVYRSSPSLYSIFDRSSGTTEPYSVAKTRLNMIGGDAWRVAGQWIEWEMDIPEDGMYKISLKGRQNYNRGFVSNRSLSIDGKIPCLETAVIPFRYSNTWELVTAQEQEGNELYFPLKAGKHTIRLEVTLGDLGKLLTTMEDSVYRLNEIYRKILVLTGAEPDKYRDYRIETVYPEVITAMDYESRVLYQLVDDLTAYAGERNSQTAVALTLAKQLEKFVEKPEKIPPTLQNFKENISSLGNSLVSLAEAKLDIDYLLVSGKEAELPEIEETFFTKAWHELRSFWASFFEDYNTLGNVYEGEDTIEVWMLSGRDQSTILKTMIDDTFTPKTGISVNVKLISPEALMPAVVAGTGPDIAISVGNADPVNYALRNAALDISGMPGFDGVLEEFYESSIIPFRYNGGVYGLPETQNFNVMFYRKDIFEELGIEVPQTWTDLIKILPVIQKNNMNVGIPSVERKINNVASPDLSNFFAQLYQHGGTLYNEEGSATLLDTESAVEAFENYTKFFTHYKTPTVYDFVNRFRTGEMPLGFVDYNNYNTLAVFAPEIRGLWDFAVLPGTEMEDGEINRATSAWGNASMILGNTKHPEAAWEFLKWWIGSDTQVRFGRELESIMGASARYATANVVAFEQLSWSADQMKVLEEQWKWVVGTPEVPGGYYTSRHIVNAVRKVINDKEDTRETLLDYTRTINDELIKKRKEFGLEQD